MAFESPSSELIEAVIERDLPRVNALLERSWPEWDRNRALVEAAKLGDLPLLQAVLPHADPKADQSNALAWAAQNGHVAAVKCLLPFSDARAEDSQALRWAAENGDLEVVECLLPFSDVDALGGAALIGAVDQGHVAIVRCLLTRANARLRRSETLRLAVVNDQPELVDLLLPVSDAVALGERFMSAMEWEHLDRLASRQSPEEAQEWFVRIGRATDQVMERQDWEACLPQTYARHQALRRAAQLKSDQVSTRVRPRS